MHHIPNPTHGLFQELQEMPASQRFVLHNFLYFINVLQADEYFPHSSACPLTADPIVRLNYKSLATRSEDLKSVLARILTSLIKEQGQMPLLITLKIKRGSYLRHNRQ